MKKFYSIGREEGCDILLWDETNQVSRNHAQLRMDDSGHYWLTDTSTNGTYVNGIRQVPNVEVPVKRGDAISFAHVEDLDWSLVEKGKRPWIWVLVAVAAVGLLAGIGTAVYFVWDMNSDKDQVEEIEEFTEPVSEPTDCAKDTVSVPVKASESAPVEAVQEKPAKKTVKQPEKKPAESTEPKKEDPKDTESTNEIIF